jgi:hypothetical protein
MLSRRTRNPSEKVRDRTEFCPNVRTLMGGSGEKSFRDTMSIGDGARHADI